MPFQFLDMVDGLTRLDPIRTYPSRAGELVARLCGAEGYRVELESGESCEGVPTPPPTRVRVKLPLRYGRQSLGTIHLILAEGRDRLDPHDLRLARWAARVMGRCLSYAARMRHEGRRTGQEDVAEALAKAPLTPRERDVVALLMSGASTRQIAAETSLTVGTVHTYLKRIYPKLGVRSRVELVARMAGTDGMNLSQPPPPSVAAEETPELPPPPNTPAEIN